MPTSKFILAILFIITCQSCREEPIKNMKDLEQSMMDMKIYQENLGEGIRAGKLEDTKWLLDGLDSTINTVAATLKEHHKMNKPFSYYKKKLLDKPLNGLHKAFENNDTALAGKQYILLVDKCNKCHIDLEIDKTVRY